MEYAEVRIYRLHYNELGHLHVCFLDDKILEAALVDEGGGSSFLWNSDLKHSSLFVSDMKQFITIDQLKELSDQAKQRLGEWIHRNPSFVPLDLPLKDQSYQVIWTEPKTPNNKTYWLPLLSIGQMIEFLDEHNRGYESMNIIPLINDIKKDYIDVKPVDDWCDSLWEAVKEVLETENGSDTEET